MKLCNYFKLFFLISVTLNRNDLKNINAKIEKKNKYQKRIIKSEQMFQQKYKFLVNISLEIKSQIALLMAKKLIQDLLFQY